MSGVLVHEWIAQTGGSENVLQALGDLYPEADVVCLWNDSDRFDPERVEQTWLARTPLRRSKALALPFMPATWRRLAYRGYDWALVSSHLFAHHVRFLDQPTDFRKLVYVHTPARYIWTPELDARGRRVGARVLSAGLRPLDRRRAREGAEFAANSGYVRDRIRRAWDVDARVIHPPVEVEQIQRVADWCAELDAADTATWGRLPHDFVLGASRFVPYKRLDLVIRTGEILGLPVVLAGHGPELPALRELAAAATVPVHFVIAPSHALLFALYQRTALFVFPAVEDFGIMPVEAMAAGAPVLAQSVGGTAETVVAGRTGALVPFDCDLEIRAGAEKAMSTHREQRRSQAARFAMARFGREIDDWVAAA